MINSFAEWFICKSNTCLINTCETASFSKAFTLYQCSDLKRVVQVSKGFEHKLSGQEITNNKSDSSFTRTVGRKRPHSGNKNRQFVAKKSYLNRKKKRKKEHWQTRSETDSSKDSCDVVAMNEIIQLKSKVQMNHED